MRKFLILSTILIIISASALARLGHGAEFQTWTDIATIYRFADNWRYDGDQGVRGVLSGNDFDLLYFRPSVRYRFKPWLTAHGGVRFFQTFWDNDKDTFEIGPWQGLRFTWPKLEEYAFTHYFRLEQRMIWQTQGENHYDFQLRSRYQLGFRTEQYDLLLKNGIFLAGSLELFWNLDESFSEDFINRIRYDIGVGSRLSDAWRIQLHCVLQDGRAIDETLLNPFGSDEVILRLRLFYRFN